MKTNQIIYFEIVKSFGGASTWSAHYAALCDLMSAMENTAEAQLRAGAGNTRFKPRSPRVWSRGSVSVKIVRSAKTTPPKVLTTPEIELELAY